MFPWWLFDGDKYSMQILMGGLEGRYWLGSKEKRINSEVLTGHFLGLYAGGRQIRPAMERRRLSRRIFIAPASAMAGRHVSPATCIWNLISVSVCSELIIVTTMPVITTKLYCGKIMGVTPGSDRQRRKSRWYGC